VKELLKDQTSKLQIWVNHEQEWYSLLRANLIEAVNKRQNRGEETLKDAKSRALHLRCEHGKLLVNNRDFLGMKGVDLESIILSLILNDNNKNRKRPHEFRTLLLFAFYAVGRGGEAKFLRWDHFFWDDFFQVLEGIWKRIKTMIHQNVYFQCCFLGYLCDLYHSLGCFFAVEDGLFRHPAEGPNAEKIRIRNRFIFPHLWNISDQSVATTLTNIIRDHSDECFKKLNQSRSLRVGANTELAMHPNISTEQQRIAGGFSAGNNSELYTRLNPDLCLPAANARGQWPQASGKKVYPPSLEVLIASKESTLEKIDELIGYLYIICVPEFLKDAKLRPLLYTCTVSLIMHYQEMQEKCGSTNSVGQKLGRSLCQANIVSTSAQANTKLFEWSQVIKNDYDQKKAWFRIVMILLYFRLSRPKAS